MTLKSRQVQIPYGFKFVQPEVRTWRPKNYISFDQLVQQVIQLRKGNQALVAKGLATDYPTVASEVEQFNVRICQNMGWNNFLAGGEPAWEPPKSIPLSPQQKQGIVAAAGVVKKIWSGIRTLSEWYESREPGVPKEQSEARAKVCVACPLNEPGDFSKWFTIPAAEAIRRQISRFSDRHLSTTMDDKLHVCSACLCVNKLSVHVPIKLKLANLSPDVRAALHPSCWVQAEEKSAG